jgi:hyaluronate lyase
VVTGSYQEGNAKLVYSGNWTTGSDPLASGGSFAFADSSGSSMTIRFSGIELDWFASKSPDYGNATVTVDGGSPATVSLYSADVRWAEMVWSTGVLTAGTHTVKIEWAGTKDTAATGTGINIDAVDVTGVLK